MLCDVLMHRALFYTQSNYNKNVPAADRKVFLEMCKASHNDMDEFADSWRNNITWRLDRGLRWPTEYVLQPCSYRSKMVTWQVQLPDFKGSERGMMLLLLMPPASLLQRWQRSLLIVRSCWQRLPLLLLLLLLPPLPSPPCPPPSTPLPPAAETT